jgi:hypothetical protein
MVAYRKSKAQVPARRSRPANEAGARSPDGRTRLTALWEKRPIDSRWQSAFYSDPDSNRNGEIIGIRGQP